MYINDNNQIGIKSSWNLRIIIRTNQYRIIKIIQKYRDLKENSLK